MYPAELIIIPKESESPGQLENVCSSHWPFSLWNSVSPDVLCLSRIQGVPSAAYCRTTWLEVSLETSSVVHDDELEQVLEQCEK